MGEARLHQGAGEYYTRRVVSLTVIPSFDQTGYILDPTVEAKLIKLVANLGPNCRVTKFHWLIATDEACGGIIQDLNHEGVENVLVFSALVGTDWKFWCKPHGETDNWEFDGVGVFLQ
jgi:hypothetical protein